MRKFSVLIIVFIGLSVNTSLDATASERNTVRKAPVLKPFELNLTPAKPGRILNVETSATATWIDTAANAYSMFYAGVNPIFYEPVSGDISWAGRALGENLSGSGVLGYNYSTDGGMTWPNRQIDLNDPNHTTGARYPSGFAVADFPMILYTENNGGGGTSNGDPILMWDFGWGFGLWTYNDFHETTPYPDLWDGSPVLADNGNLFASFVSYTNGEDYYLSYSGNISDLTDFTVNLDASIFPSDVPNSSPYGAAVLNKSSYSYSGGGYMTVGGAWDMDSASSFPRADDRNLVYKLSSNDGATWGNAVVVGEADIAGFPSQSDTSNAFFQTYATNHQVDGHGDVHFTGNLVYYDTDSSQAVITAHVSSEGGTWTLHVVDEPDRALTGGALCGTGCEMGEISVTPSGGLVFVYLRGTAETDTVVGGMIASDVYVSYSSDDGFTWSIPENITNTPGVDELLAHTSPTVEVIDASTERVHIIYFVDVEEPIGNLLGKHVYYHDYYDYTAVPLTGPQVIITPSSLDFGVLEVGQSATLQLMVHSIGTDTVSVTSITNSMPDYYVSPTSLVIPPGETEQVDVTFSPLSIGVIEDSLTIESNDPDDPIVTVFLSGEGEAGDLTVAVYSTFGDPGDTVIVPVQVTETGGFSINSSEFELVSDSIVVRPLDGSFDGAIPEGTDWILQYNAQPDTFNVAMGGADTLSGFGDLVVLRYVIDAAAIEGQSSYLAFHSFIFNEGIPMAAVIGGRIDVGIPYGDISRDGAVHAYDGALIMMYLAGHVTFDHNQEIVAEVSGDGNITSFDASLILQYVVGLIDEFPAAGGTMPPFSPAAAFDIPDLSAALGEIIIFPVMMEGVHDVVSLEARLEYDPSVLTLEEFSVGDGFDGWLKSEVTEDGIHRLYLAHGTPANGDLLLGEARFRVSDGASEGCAISLTDVRLNEEPVVENAASAQFSLTITGVLGESDGIPTEYGLSQNYPNPFNPVTEIRYALPKDAKVKLSIYNLLGQEVARLVDGEMPAGYHRVKWDAGVFSSGVYLYRIQTDDFVDTKKLILMK